MPVKINTLELENVKRVKAVSLTPSPDGLTIIGGNNAQGKTSVLDAICWLLGGKKFEPSNPKRDGAYADPILRATLSNGLIVERRGKNSALKVIDPDGKKSGQQLLDSFISELALDLPKFLNASDKDKAAILLNIIGVGDKLAQMEQQETQLYNQRRAVGQIADQKRKHAADLPTWTDVPEQPVSASELIAQQQKILQKNAENQRLRENLKQCEDAVQKAFLELESAKHAYAKAEYDLNQAKRSAEDLQDESTAELEKNLSEIESINAKIRDNQIKNQAEQEAEELSGQYDELTSRIEEIRQNRQELLDDADLPLEGLSVQDGRLLYHGKAWDCMSSAEQLRVATAVVRRIKPECGFVLLDRLEAMDIETLRDFSTWLESEHLQAIATRVSTGEECSIIIEDGCIQPKAEPVKPVPPRYVPGWNK